MLLRDRLRSRPAIALIAVWFRSGRFQARRLFHRRRNGNVLFFSGHYAQPACCNDIIFARPISVHSFLYSVAAEYLVYWGVVDVTVQNGHLGLVYKGT